MTRGRVGIGVAAVLRFAFRRLDILFKSRRRLIAHVLSLALLIAQLGMAAHAFSHLGSDPDGLPSQTQVQSCGQCLSFTPLLGMVGSAPDIGPIPRADVDGIIPAPATPIADVSSWPAFRSRAPPVLL